MNKARHLAILLATGALGLAALPAEATISACVQRSNGAIRILEPGQTCPSNSYRLDWDHPQPFQPPPKLHTLEVIGMSAPGTGMARAFCYLQGWKVTGGGGIALDGTPLRGSFPISTTDGVFASDGTAIGWQAMATTADTEVYAWVICSSVH